MPAEIISLLSPPAETISSLLYYDSRGDNINNSLLSSGQLQRDDQLLYSGTTTPAETAPPLSYLPATVEISLESPRATTDSYGGSTPVSTYQTDNNNSSSQSSRTHLLDAVQRATTLCAHFKPLRQQRARRRPFLPTYLMCM